MAKKKKTSGFKVFMIIGATLILIQASVLFIYKRKNQPASFKDAMNSAISNNDKIDPEKRDTIKVQMAISNYYIENGKFPEALEDLIPKYFEKVPIDPQTAEAFVYKVADGRFYLGADAAKITGNAQQAKGPVGPQNETQALLASLDSSAIDSFVYDPSGKRDPFRSFDFSDEKKNLENKPPLERYDYGDLKLSAILLNTGEPKAIIEDGTGKGHTVKVGSVLGLYGGKIVKIETERILILESTIEFTGESSSKTVELFLPKEELDFGSLSKKESVGGAAGKGE